MMSDTTLLRPAIVLVVWTLVMWTWMLSRRLPAMRAHKVQPQDALHTRDLAARLPSAAQAPADNYNHLLEQPTIFYATCIIGAIAGGAGWVGLVLAWSYVGLRIVHSVWQATVGRVMVRFSLFAASTLTLIALAILVALRL